MKASHVEVIAYPRHDPVFRADAEASARDGAATPWELEQRLRDRYSQALVVDGIDHGETQRWYAYRDGYWVNEDY